MLAILPPVVLAVYPLFGEKTCKDQAVPLSSFQLSKKVSMNEVWFIRADVYKGKVDSPPGSTKAIVLITTWADCEDVA